MRRRRVAPAVALGCVALSVALWIGAAAQDAGGSATVVPGTYTITVGGGGGNLHLQRTAIAPGCSNGVDDDLDGTIDATGGIGSDGSAKPPDALCASKTDNDEGPATVAYIPPSFKVQVEGDGSFSAAAKDITWQPTPTRQNGGPLGIVDASIVFKSDDAGAKAFTGRIDAATGRIDATWRWHLETTAKLPLVGPVTLFVGNPTSPLTTNLSTDTDGGVRFDAATLSMTLVNDTMTVPAATCAGNALACSQAVVEGNRQLGLPAGAGQSALQVVAAIDRNPVTVGNQASPDLTLAKTHAGDLVAGRPDSYTLTVRNIGAGPTSGPVVLTETPPTGLAVDAMAGPGWTCAENSCTHPGPVAAGGFLPGVTVTATAAAAGELVNTARVRTQGDSDASNDTAEDPTHVAPPTPPTPDLALAKSHEGNARVGVPVSYDLTVTNVGGGAATGPLTLTDTLPAGLENPSGAGAGWTCTTIVGSVSCTHPGPVPAGGSLPVVTVTATPVAAGEVVNTAALSAVGGDPDRSNDTASDPTHVDPAPGPPDLSLDKSHEGASFSRGVPGTWTLTVANGGAGPTTGPVTVEDDLPEGVIPVSAGGDGWDCESTGAHVSCVRSALLDPGEVAPAVSVVATPGAPGTLTNTATVHTEGDANMLDDGDSDAVAVVVPAGGGPDLAVAVVANGTQALGSSATLLVRVGNVGSVVAPGAVEVTMVVPGPLGFLGASGDGWTCEGPSTNLHCTNDADVAPGGSLPDIGVLTRPFAPGSNLVKAEVVASGDANAANDTAAMTIEVASWETQSAAVTEGDGGSSTGSGTGSATTTGTAAAAATTLPVTGAESGRLLAAALCLVVLGAGLALTAQSRGE